MGARTNFHFKTDTGTLTLYSHWGGDTKNFDLANALNAAMPRIKMGDMGYALRIIVSNIINDGWSSETGFGLYINDMDSTEEQYGNTIVDLSNKTINDNGNIVTFDMFIQYHGLTSLATV